MQQSSTTPSLHLGFGGLRKIIACSQPSLQCLLVSTVFGMVSSLHPTFFNDFYTCFLIQLTMPTMDALLVPIIIDIHVYTDCCV